MILYSTQKLPLYLVIIIVAPFLQQTWRDPQQDIIESKFSGHTALSGMFPSDISYQSSGNPKEGFSEIVW